MSDEHSPTDDSLTDVEVDGVVGGISGTCTLHGGVAKPHGELRDDGPYRCDGRGYLPEGPSGRG
jgi:hypothetical protein